jgi:superfamily II DNA/RNA helicase
VNLETGQRAPRANEEVTIISISTESTDEQPGGFAELGVAAHIVSALDAQGISSPFPIQASTIPVALGGADIIGQAKTGTGKTLAFGIPLLQRIEESAEPEGAEQPPAATAPAAKAASGRRRGRSAGGNAGTKLPPAGAVPQALIVVPTRELCTQVCADLSAAGSTNAIRVQALYGGRAYEPQVKALTEGIDIAVATPGRLLDLVNQGHLNLGRVRTLVLDEADEMLDLGFLPDVERIIRLLPAARQTMLFSATMPGAVISLARQYMNRPTHIRAADPHDEGVSVANIKQFVYRAHDLDKIEMLARILQANGRGLTMVFARTKRAVARITDELQDRHFAVGAVHGDLAQGAREQALRAFRNGKVDVLVATDVAARGIDVEGVTHVINYQCPEDEKVYTHRIGRTGRAGRTGISVTLVDWEDMPRWGLINKALVLDLAEPVELYSTSPQLYADLDIPAGVKGALPKQDRVRAGLEAEELEDLGETGRHAGGGNARGGKPRGARAEEAPEAAEPRRPRTPRQRRRTRGGQAADIAGTAAPTSPLADTGLIAVHSEGAASRGAAPVVESQMNPFHPPKLEPVPVFAAPDAEESAAPKTRSRSRTRARAAAAPVEDAAVVTESVTARIEPTAEAAEKPKRTRTRKRVGAVAEEASVAAPVAEVAAPIAEAPVETPAEEQPARKRARKRTIVAESAAPTETVESVSAPEEVLEPAQPVASAKRTRKRATAPVTEPAANVVVEPAAAAEAEAEQKPARKRAPRKTTSAAKKTAAPEVNAGAPTASPSRTRAGSGSGAHRLAPGSLADPGPAPEPVRPAPVNEPVELAEAVFTQEPILPNTQRTSGERAPRKRAASSNSRARKSVAAQSAPGADQVTSVVHEAPEQAAADPLNIGPVANRRRIQI